MNETPTAGRIHHAIVEHLVAQGRAPRLDELAAGLGATVTAVRPGLEALVAEHGVVLDPGGEAVWVIHPFATTPTLFWVERGGSGWWAPCAWCAFGIAALVGDCVITTRVAGQGDVCRVAVTQGRPDGPGRVVHFPIPVRRAWQNVHRFCASTLLFESAGDVARWCERQGTAPGAVVPIEQVAALGAAWYGGHRAADWRKHSTADAQRIFRSVGLAGEFWDLEAGAGRF